MTETTPHYRTVASDNKRWEGFPFRPDDIVISAPPKCGMTWMQMICGLLIFQDTKFDRPLAEISPWLDMVIRDRAEVFALLEAQRHRRFIKTHTPLDGLPSDERVTYVCVGRDPRDVAVSWDHHLANMNLEVFFAALSKTMGWDDLAQLVAQDPPPTGETLEERFWQWMDNPAPPVHAISSFRSTLHHFEEALRADDRPNVLLFHYNDLKTDLEGEMRRLADRLGIAVPEDRWPALVNAASFERMRERADELVPNSTDALWQENRGFFHSGRGGQWQEFFDEEARRRYEARVAALATPTVSTWAHAGRRGAPRLEASNPWDHRSG
jgi:aryl sulfotransferase